MDKFKIFFYHPKDGIISHTVVESEGLLSVIINTIKNNEIYKDWICVKCLQTGMFAWRDGQVNNQILQKELATQLLVESNLRS